MSESSKHFIMECTRDIAVAALQGNTYVPNGESGKNLAAFLQNVYDKLTELYDDADSTES